MLTESLVLALLGAAAGLGVGALGIRAFTALQPPAGWRVAEIPIDLRVLAFVLVVATGSSVLFGLAPAMRGATSDAMEGLREGLRASRSKRRQTIGRSIVVAEIALALLLVTGSGLLLRSFASLRQVDPGFAAEDRVAAWVVLPRRYEENADILTFVDDVVARLGRLSGVRDVTYTTRLPFEGSSSRTTGLSVEGRGPVELSSYVGGRLVAPSYFRVLDVPLLLGRTFEESDDELSEPVVVINQEAMRRIFRDEDPIGRRIAWAEGPSDATTWYRVVGVVGDEHQDGLRVRPPMEAFIPFRRIPPTRINFVLHAPGRGADDLREAVRAELAAVDPLVPLSRFLALEETYAVALGRERFLLTLIGTFGALALILAVVGVYGLVAEATRKRTHEIGIRIALGAGPVAVGGSVLRTGLALTAVGLAIGVPAALAGARLLGSVLFGVLPHDLITFLVAPAVLALAAALACLIPTLRAVRLDPVVVLRDD
jgi:predicted permease